MPRKNTPPKPPPPPPVKATQAEVDKRVTDVVKLIIAGAARAAILQHAATKWEMSERQADEYIRRAKVLIQEENSADRAANHALAVARMNDIYQRTVRVQDYQRAIAAQRELNQLQGLYAPTKTEIAGEGGGPLNIIFKRDPGFNKPAARLTDEGVSHDDGES